MAAIRSSYVNPRLILFGDSLTQYSFSVGGWGSLIADAFQRNVDVINRGFSGYNSLWLKIVLKNIFEPIDISSFDAVVVLIGTNDASLPHVNYRQHVPLKLFKENMSFICRFLLSGGIKKENIILISPPSLHEENYVIFCSSKDRAIDRSNEVTKQYAEVVLSIASSLNLKHVDLFSLTFKMQKNESLFVDGLHLSEKGNSILAEALLPHLNDIFGSLPQMMPDWKNIDEKNPEKDLLK